MTTISCPQPHRHAHVFSTPLPQSFYNRPTLKVAKELLGKYLLRDSASGKFVAKIIDVEAYVGQEDKACHASKGRTKRTEVLFGPPGQTYVYLIYGMHYLLNFVTERPEFPAAILIRGVEIVEQEGAPLSSPIRIDGPGRVCRQLHIDKSLNCVDTTIGQYIWVEDRGERIRTNLITALPRIGVDYAGEWAKKLWRFCLPSPAKHDNKPRAPRIP
ncbi:MAG: putative 3-methyladenine DNA glycosylase [Nitrospirales bacterium]|nr:MAG: putative 3-methyladenine DNA glycosylase [Nitrospirales bacterium]